MPKVELGHNATGRKISVPLYLDILCRRHLEWGEFSQIVHKGLLAELRRRGVSDAEIREAMAQAAWEQLEHTGIIDEAPGGRAKASAKSA